MRKDSIANKLMAENHKDFWKEIKYMNNSNLPLPNTIDNVTGTEEVIQLWKRHYQDIFNCLKSINESVLFDGNEIMYSDVPKIRITEVSEAIKNLDDNKSCGFDGLCAEHFKFCSERLKPLLSLCFTSFFVHGFLPETMIIVVLAPIIKNKSASLCDKNNYRPIALASIMSKIFEKLLYTYIDKYLNTNCNQFGFKSKHGTDMCIYVLKEALLHYKNSGSNIFSCFLDASKAFDRVNHSVLFQKLIRRGVPAVIVRLLVYWYTNQTMINGRVYSLKDSQSLMGLDRVEYCLHTYFVCMLMISVIN